ncbi:hypothetical protein EZV62_009241 [Acer yangbiense]|uniref:Transcription factor CBF/NF-Y/archaeal histone domain-containing protein n=1 Tax=Acer yangbiense TaxID=1000413 RepID=A0A5C7IHL4_9ROSI|nr:hypothetical protein EZV62_009241 [Acer yangbiense]
MFLVSALTIHPRNNTVNARIALPPTINVNSANNMNNNNNPPPPEDSGLREQDQYMPIANVIRIMRRTLPPHAKISDDAKETVQECVSEYISFVTGEANDRCHKEQRKTITAEDVIWAMNKLGFDNYVEPLSIYLRRYRNSENQRSSAPKDPNARHGGVGVGGGGGVGVMDYATIGMGGGGGPIGPPNYNVGPQPNFYDPMMNVYNYRNSNFDSGGGSSSQANLPSPGFDPFAQFK